MRVFIYYLRCPISKEPRYIGKSNENRIAGRLKEHMQQKRYGRWSHKLCWIDSLKRKNLKPTLHIIDEGDENNFKNLERYWIRCYKKLGFKLTNSTEGGEGMAVLPKKRIMTSKQKADISTTLKAFFSKPENLTICAKGGRGSGGVGRLTRRKTTGYVGVFHDSKNTGKFRASLNCNGKSVYVGQYTTDIEAAEAYDKAALYYRGREAKINFPDKREEYLATDIPSFIDNVTRHHSSMYAYVSKNNQGYYISKDTSDKYIGCFKTEEEAVAKVSSVTGYTAEQLRAMKRDRSMNRKRDVSQLDVIVEPHT